AGGALSAVRVSPVCGGLGGGGGGGGGAGLRLRERRHSAGALPLLDFRHSGKIGIAARAMIRAAIALACALLSLLPAAAMVGGAQPASEGAGRAVVMLTGSHGTFCSGVALARDLVLTAAHCVLPGADYKLVEFDAARQ